MTSSQPTFEELVDELQGRADSILDQHAHRMRDAGKLPDRYPDANGSVWTVEEYLADPIGHPNCRRMGLPRV